MLRALQPLLDSGFISVHGVPAGGDLDRWPSAFYPVRVEQVDLEALEVAALEGARQRRPRQEGDLAAAVGVAFGVKRRWLL